MQSLALLLLLPPPLSPPPPMQSLLTVVPTVLTLLVVLTVLPMQSLVYNFTHTASYSMQQAYPHLNAIRGAPRAKIYARDRAACVHVL